MQIGTGDVKDNYGTIAGNGFSEAGLARFAAPGHWNDPDMLEVGNGRLPPDDAVVSGRPGPGV